MSSVQKVQSHLSLCTTVDGTRTPILNPVLPVACLASLFQCVSSYNGGNICPNFCAIGHSSVLDVVTAIIVEHCNCVNDDSTWQKSYRIDPNCQERAHKSMLQSLASHCLAKTSSTMCLSPPGLIYLSRVMTPYSLALAT